MSDQEDIMDRNKEEQEDDAYDEESSKDQMIPKPNTAKVDINAWRKRQSIAYTRNLLLGRRMSRGEELENNFKKSIIVVFIMLFFVRNVI